MTEVKVISFRTSRTNHVDIGTRKVCLEPQAKYNFFDKHALAASIHDFRPRCARNTGQLQEPHCADIAAAGPSARRLFSAMARQARRVSRPGAYPHAQAHLSSMTLPGFFAGDRSAHANSTS